MDLLKEKHIDTSRGLHYRYYVSDASQADPSKPVILLCHGFPDSAHLWQYAIPHLLKSKLRFIVPDLLGTGGSSKPTDLEYWNIKDMVDDVVEILDAEKVSGPVLPMGHDWGAYFVQRFYMLNTERCIGLITVCIAYFPPTASFDLDKVNRETEKEVGYPVYKYWELFLAPDAPRLLIDNMRSFWHVMHGDVDDWMRKMFCTQDAMRAFIEANRTDVPLKAYAKDEALWQEWSQTKRDHGIDSQLSWYRALATGVQGDAESKLAPEIKKPYLYIAADGDAVCRADFIDKPIKEGVVTDVTRKVIHAGHWCPYEKPEEIAAITLAWLKDQGFSAA